MTGQFNKKFACIVGAPRTGTTSLARFLRNHPSVCFSKVKEPHFFSQWDMTSLADEELREAVSKEYLGRFFANCAPGTSMLMEGSVTYLFVPEQMRPILKLWPDAKFIIGLRDPMQMIPSLYQRLLFLGDETVEDFDTAWRLVEERKNGRKIPRSCVEPRWLRYDELGKLGQYVEQFISVVGRERCFFALYDDVKKDSAALYREVLEFLGLPPFEHHDTEPKRRGRAYRIGWLQRLLKRPPGITRKIMAGNQYRQRVESLEKLQKDNSIVVRAISRSRKALLRWNEVDARPIQMSPEVRSQIRANYKDDIAHLGEIIGRDLSHWLAEKPG